MKMIEIDIQNNLNVDEEEIRNFMSREKEYTIQKTVYFQNQKEIMVNVVGWENGKSIPAKAIKVEDSGDGEAWLIYGGNEGIRLRKTNSAKQNPKAFSLDNKDEWGELYLYYHKDLFQKYIQPFILA